MVFDKDAREQALNHKKSFLIQAPAGSGKTSLLVQRLLKLLLHAEKAPEEILAITFTKKAAYEMRVRIIATLEKEIASNLDYGRELKEKVEKWELLKNPNRLKIQTIDAFCNSIVKRMPIMANFGAKPEVTENPQILYAQAVDQLLQNITPDIANLLEHLDNNQLALRQLLIAMLPLREQWLPCIIDVGSQDSKKKNQREKLEYSLQIIIQQALGKVSSCLPEEVKELWPWPTNSIDDLTSWQNLAKILLTKDNNWRKTVTKAQGFPAKSENKKAMLKLLKELKALENLKTYCSGNNFKEKLSVLKWLPPVKYSDYQWDIVASLITVLPLLVAELKLIFAAKGEVDFQEISFAASYALGKINSPSDLALALDYKIRHILIDEFQDTSFMQYNLLQQLTQDWQTGDGRTLFLVGDPMQSIYRFRQAEVSLFLQVKQHGIGNVKLNFLQLTTNFRSNEAIISWINRVFTASFPVDDDIYQGAVSYMPCNAVRAATAGQQIATQVFADSNDEAENIINLIKNIQNKNSKPSIAILVRSRSHLIDILPALNKANISYQGVEIENLYERAVIQDLLALTRVLLHVDDMIAWLAVLRAPWCGLLLQDLHIIANSKERIDIAITKEDLSVDGRLRATVTVAIISEALALRASLSFSEVVKVAWGKLSANKYLDDDAIKDAEFFFNLLIKYEDSRELFEIDFLTNKIANLFKSPKTIDNTAVQVMTIHKSKGLEFDVVLIPGLAKRPVVNKEQLLLFNEIQYNEHNYLLLAPIRSYYETHDNIYSYLKNLETNKQKFELIRLFYVAATRAKNSLYLFGVMGKQEKPIASSMLATIWPAIKDEVGLDINNQEKSLKITSDGSINSMAKYLHRLSSDNFTICNNEIKVKKELNLKLDTLHNYWLKHVGTIVHQKLHQLLFTENIDLNCQQQLQQLGVSSRHLQQANDLIITAVNSTRKDQTGQWLLANDYSESYGEWALSYPVKVKQQPIVGGKQMVEFINIVIDRAFLDGDIFWIIDYKVCTSQDMQAAIAEYTAQLQHYAEVVKKMKPKYRHKRKNSIKTALYFVLQQKLQVVHDCVE